MGQAKQRKKLMGENYGKVDNPWHHQTREPLYAVDWEATAKAISNAEVKYGKATEQERLEIVRHVLTKFYATAAINPDDWQSRPPIDRS